MPCHTAAFSYEGDVAFASGLIFPWFTLDSCAPVPKDDATTSPRGKDRLKGATAGRSSDVVSVSAVLNSPQFPVHLLSEHSLWLGEAVITTLRFASTGQGDSSERQNLCTTPGLNTGGRKNAKGRGAIWPSGDKAAKKLETLTFDDHLWAWPHAFYHQVSGPCGAPHIQRISTSPCMVPLSSRATIT